MNTKVLFLSPNLGCGGGGAERQIVTVACLLKDAGCDVEFLCYAGGDFYAHILNDKQIPIRWLIFPNYFRRLFGVRKFIRSGSYDAVISFLETPNFLNNFAAIGGKRWKVITGERSAQERTFFSRKGKIFCWFQRYADYIVCNSDNARKMWMKHYPAYEKKLKTVYNNVTLQPVTSEYVPKKDGKLHIVVAASYLDVKNPFGFVKALSMLSDDEKCLIHVDWYGKNDDHRKAVYDAMSKQIMEYSLHNISLHPAIENIQDKMKEADIVAIFSKYEGLPNAICEGMMLEKPIIMTRISDYAVLVDETNGFLCDWDKPETMKDALVQALRSSKEELIEMGKSSKSKAECLFSAGSIKNKWMSLIR